MNEVFTLRSLMEARPDLADLPMVMVDSAGETFPITDGWFHTHGGDDLRKEVEDDLEQHGVEGGCLTWEDYCKQEILGGRKRLVFSID